MLVSGGDVILRVPQHYTALAGELTVVFVTQGDDSSSLNDTDWHLDIRQSRDLSIADEHPSPLATVDIPGGYSDGEVSIGCGVIDAVGQLVVRLVDSTTSDVLAQSSIVDVAWPSVALRLPDGVSALTADVPVTLEVYGVACQSQHSHVYYTLRLIYLGFNSTSPPSPNVVFEQQMATLARLSSHIVVACSLIDRAGSYQAVLTSSRRPEVPIAVSNVVVVAWSRRYSLSLSSTSPSSSKHCRRHVIVRHAQPRCDSVVYTIRVSIRRLPSNINRVAGDVVDDVMSRDWQPVTERRVKSSRSSVAFDCSSFEADSLHDEHCVELLSGSSDGNVYVHRRFCTGQFASQHTGL